MPKFPPGWTAVVGPGAIGAVLAVSLRHAAKRVLLISRSPERVRREGLSVLRPDGKKRRCRDWLEISRRPRAREGCEAVFLCVKSGDLLPALAAAKNIVGPRTAVISLLNGVGHAAAVKRAFGTRRSVLGACYIASTRTGMTAARHAGGDRIMLGRTLRNRRAVDAAARLLKDAGWRVSTAKSEERVLWTKMIVNAAVNPIGALTKKTNGEIASHPALRSLIREVVLEACRVARAAGHPPLYPNMAERILRANAKLPHQVNSMAQDLAAGRATEANVILKPFLTAARRTGTPIRYLDRLHLMMRRLEAELS